MKIAFLVVKNINRGGGIEKYTLELGSRLVARGHDVTVYSMKHYGNVPPMVNGMRIVPVPTIRHRALEKIVAGGTGAFKALALPNDTIMHFHATGPGLFAWMSRLRGRKCVLQLHGVDWQRSRWGGGLSLALKVIERAAIRQPHVRTTVSESQCRFFSERYGVDVVYIPTGSDIKPHVEAVEILKWGLQPRRYVLFASRLVREKGAHYLIPAFRRLPTDYHLVVAGDAQGEEEYKKDLRELAGDDPRILFPGFVEGRPLEELFSNAAVYVQPSDVEGLSIALLEAMSYGLCCLVSDIPENLEALGGCGARFRNGDIDDLARQLGPLLTGPSASGALGEQARERVRKHYSWDLVTDRFEDLYRGLIER